MPRTAVTLKEVLPRKAGAPRGTRHGKAKLTDDEVRQIRQLWKEGGAIAGLARAFGVSRATIWRVVYAKTWIHVTD